MSFTATTGTLTLLIRIDPAQGSGGGSSSEAGKPIGLLLVLTKAG